jgi:hypothetical protein
MENNDTIVECSVCNHRYVNHIGSTECCGAIAFLVKDNKTTNDAVLFIKTEKGIEPTTLNIKK